MCGEYSRTWCPGRIDAESVVLDHSEKIPLDVYQGYTRLCLQCAIRETD